MEVSAAALAVTAASVLFTAEMGLRVGGSRLSEIIDDVGSLVAALIAPRSARRRRGMAPRRRAAAGRCWAPRRASGGARGDLVPYEVLRHHELPFPSPADAAFLAAVPLAVAALLAFPSLPTRAASRARPLCDGSSSRSGCCA